MTTRTETTAPRDEETERLIRVIRELNARGFSAQFVETGAEALSAALARIPEGSTVMTGSSTTLEQIGLPQALRTHGVRYLKDEIHGEADAKKRDRLRRGAVLADYFLGSVQAITQDGILVATDASGSRIAGYAFPAKNVIIVASVNKIVADLEAAMARAREVALPLEDARMKKQGAPGSTIGKWLIWEREIAQGRAHVILVGEPLGF